MGRPADSGDLRSCTSPGTDLASAAAGPAAMFGAVRLRCRQAARVGELQSAGDLTQGTPLQLLGF